MKFVRLVNLFLIVTFSFSCKVAVQDINYNVDQCHYCKMIISDPRFGAELVTEKGKVFKFDAIECLVPIALENGIDKYEHMVVTDYESPEEFLDARSAAFLISENHPSPMGANLSAFKDIKKQLTEKGKWYSWTELVEHFKLNQYEF